MSDSKKSSGMSWRSRHRNAAHQQAHSLPVDLPASVSNDPLVPAGPAQLIDTPSALAELIDHLSGVDSFGYDSEFIGELTYIPKLCLIQVSSAQRVALIDPLAGLDLSPFWQLLCDEKVEKIVHAGQQDLEPVIRLHQGRPANVFDTQIAAGFVGIGYPVALSKLVKELISVKLGKGLTFSHWDQRPLSASQLHYAAEDVRYLPALHRELNNKLQTNGHADWARQECDAMAQVRLYQFDPQAQLGRLRGTTSLSAQGLAIARELLLWRDAAAKCHDVPPRSLVRDEVLVDMARTPIKSVEKLNRVRGLPKPVEAAHGMAIVEAINRACALPPDQMPTVKQHEEGPVEKFRADGLWALVQCLSAGLGIDPSLVSSRQETGELYRALTNGNAQTPDLRLLQTWRHSAVGQTVINMVLQELRAEFYFDKQGLHSHTPTK
ncbi:MAG: ribonuclease D [Phycisphaerales bacterium]|jgi:ribonuclease D|nr:ribonuclease D [Phycisphaerales bacterium]